MSGEHPHRDRQAALANVHTSSVLGPLILLNSCQQHFQILILGGFTAPGCLTDHEADQFVRMSCLHFTSQDTERRATVQLAPFIPKMTSKTDHPDLTQIAVATGELLYDYLGNTKTLPKWQSLTDLAGHNGNFLAKNINRWADQRRLVEQERIFYLSRLDIIKSHAELWTLPPDHDRYPGKHGCKRKARNDSDNFRGRIRHAESEQAQIDALQLPNLADLNTQPDLPIAGPNWDPSEMRGINGDALSSVIAYDPNTSLTARELMHALRDIMAEEDNNMMMRMMMMQEIATIAAEMAQGTYQEPIEDGGA